MSHFLLNILRGCVRIHTKTQIIFLKLVKKEYREFMMTEVCKSISDRKYDVYYRLVPKDIVPEPFDRKVHIKKYAIVLQGPIRVEEDFTLKTVMYYRNMYPEAVIIVSTWKDEAEDVVEKIRETGTQVILCEKPEQGGHLNINFQLTNSLAGIQKAKELGVEYVLKTRTDQCLYKEYIFEYFQNLIGMFPVNDNSVQKSRIIALSMNYGNMFYPYFLSDFMYFGAVEDMIKLLSVPKDTRTRFSMPPGATRRDFAKMLYAPEVYIIVNYLRSLGHECDFSVKDHWDIIKKYFICVDRKTVGLVWPKYEGKYKEHCFFGDYFMDNNEKLLKTRNFDFVNWFNLYSGSLVYEEAYETYADVEFK